MSTSARIKQRWPVERMLERIGHSIPPKGKFPSPCRPDNTPSCEIWGGKVVDRTTGERWDSIDLWAHHKTISVREAFKELAAEMEVGRFVGYSPPKAQGQKKASFSYGNSEEEKRRKDLQRQEWSPKLFKASRHDCGIIASHRGLDPDATWMASEAGYLFTMEHEGAEAYVITDSARLNAKARPLHGGKWPVGAKSINLRGSVNKHPIGVVDIGDRRGVALVEGEADLLAVFQFIHSQGIGDCVAPVAMGGAAMNISPEYLRYFRGKRVRIFPDLDQSGYAGASRWNEALQKAGIDVDIFSFHGMQTKGGGQVKDLTDLCSVSHATYRSHGKVIMEAIRFAL